MAHNRIVVNLDRCTGCYSCEITCKMENDSALGEHWNKMLQRGPFGDYPNMTRYPLPTMCQQCADAPCVHVCPTGAMHKDELGLVWPDATKCIGCGYCTMACPYHAPHIDARLKRSSKCDGCRDRLVDGEQPVCVEACPLRALEFGLTSELTDRHPDAVRSILPLPDESATRPNLLILPSPAAERAEKQGGSIVNRTELHL